MCAAPSGLRDPGTRGRREREALVVGFEETAGPPAGAELEQAVGAARAEELGRAYDLVCLTRSANKEDPCAQIG